MVRLHAQSADGGQGGVADCRDRVVTSGSHCRLIHQGTEAVGAASVLPSFCWVRHLWPSPLEADAGRCGRHG